MRIIRLGIFNPSLSELETIQRNQDGKVIDRYPFFTFYLGTSLYFIPIVFLGGLNRKANVQTIGRMMPVLMAGYFFYKGLSVLISGLA